MSSAVDAALHLVVSLPSAQPYQRHAIGNHQIGGIEDMAKVRILPRLETPCMPGDGNITGRPVSRIQDSAVQQRPNLNRVYTNPQHSKAGISLMDLTPLQLTLSDSPSLRLVERTQPTTRQFEDGFCDDEVFPAPEHPFRFFRRC